MLSRKFHLLATLSQELHGRRKVRLLRPELTLQSKQKKDMLFSPSQTAQRMIVVHLPSLLKTSLVLILLLSMFKSQIAQILQDGLKQAKLELTLWFWNGKFQLGMVDLLSQIILWKSKNYQ